MKVTARVLVTEHEGEYNWYVTYSLDAYQVRGPGGYASVEEALRASPDISGPPFHVAAMPISSPLVN